MDVGGFEHDPLDDIEQLRQILSDDYPVESIFKELIQNADDAGASTLDLALIPGYSDLDHPLMRGPALVALNDGQFTKTNARAIRKLRVGDKADQPNSIGKFGLGMKSVFHLCEAFIYLASPNQPATGGDVFCNILNPWQGQGDEPGVHDDWGDISHVAGRLHQEIGRWPHGLDRWFCLWLPLRREDHLEGKHPIVPPPYPDIKKLFDPDLPCRIASVMPLLRSLEKVRVWEMDATGNMTESYRVEGHNNLQRRIGPLMHDGQRKGVAGSIRYTVNSKAIWSHHFAGFEIRVDDPELCDLMNSEGAWPTRVTVSQDLGRSVQVRDKAEPHGAVVFSYLPSSAADGNSCLTISHAVFLPLTEFLEERDCGTHNNYQLLLHGSFFLDAGRTRIKSGDELPGRWNQRLLECGVYPLILPSLDDFVRQASLKPNQVRSLTEALKGSTLCRAQQRHICGEHQWLYCISEKGGDWRLLKADEPYWEVPNPGAKHDLTRDVFPELPSLCREKRITFQGFPRLALQSGERWADDFRRLLDGIPAASVFSDSEKLGYLNRFIELEDGASAEAVAALVSLAVRALAELGIDKVRACADQFKEFLDRLPKDVWVALPDEVVESSAEKEFFSHACSLGISKLLTPSSLAPEGEAGGMLSVADASRMLSSLESFPGGGKGMKAESRAKFAVQILQQTEGDLQRKQDACGDRRLFRVHEADRSTLVLSWNQLVEMNSNGELFADSRSGLPGALRQALRDRQVMLLVEDEVSDHKASQVLFGEGVLGDCNWRACIEVLCERPALSSPENRADLLGRLIREAPAGAWGEDCRKAIRYLLHGSKDHFEESNEMLLIAGDEEDKGLWGRITQRVLRHEERDWCCVDGTLAAKLNSEQKTKLNLSPVNAESVEKLLAEADLDSVGDLGLMDNERIELLRSIQDRDLWCRLPLHETTDGAFASLQHEHTYIENDKYSPVSPLLAEHVVLIRLPRDSSLKHLYIGRVNEWTPDTAIQMCLEQPRPSAFCSVIMDALNNRGAELGTDLQDSLRKTAWLPTRYGFASPDDVINLPKLEDELTHLLSEFEGLFVDVQSIDEEIRNHDAFAQVRHWLFPKPDRALTNLGDCLKGQHDYAIGDLRPLREDAESLDYFLRAFDGCEVSFLPGYGLLKAVSEKVSNSAARTLCENLLGDIPVEKIKACLSALAAHHQQRPREEKEGCLTVHSWYLDLLVSREDFRPDVLEGLKLRNRKGQWKDASALCAEVTGVDDAYVLHDGQSDIMGQRLKEFDGVCVHEAERLGATCDTEEEGVKILRNYFRPWEGFAARELIGGFVTLLGNNDRMQKWARELLGTKDWQTIREQLEWQEHMLPRHPEQERFVFRVADTDTDQFETVTNILGKPLRVAVSNAKRYNDIFMLNLNRRVYLKAEHSRIPLDKRPIAREIVLRKLDPAAFSRAELFALLLKSSRRFLWEVYSHAPSGLESLWEELAECDQYELEKAQTRILTEAFGYFCKIHGGRLNLLHDVRQEWEDLLDRKVEEESGHTAGVLKDISLERAQRDLLHKLQERLENDREIQKEVWQSVCGKVREYQYEPSSIPFELFQNADDAVVELAEMMGEDRLPEWACRLKVLWDHRDFVLMHWGRRINLYSLGDFTSEQGRNRGFHRDLYKMLVLSASDKSEEAPSVTGKFGLGFNSVFLFSDRPRVMSGDLAFEVVGGLFPKMLPDSERERLEGYLQDFSSEAQRGVTIIELTGTEGQQPHSIVERFLRSVHVMLAFSRRIKQCILSSPHAPNEVIQWTERQVAGTSRVFVGSAQPAHQANLHGGHWLLFRETGNESILLSLGDRGIQALEKEIPTFWVTAPTNEELDVGIAINGNFAIDPGRARLGSQWERNREVAAAIGKEFGQGLAELASSSLEWSRLIQELRLAPDTTLYEFWKSLWNRMTSSKVSAAFSRGDVGGKLLKLILWDDGCGFSRLLSEKGHEVIPSCLGGDDAGNPYRVLTNMRRVLFVAAGILDQSVECFAAVCNWARFQQKWEPGSIVSITRVKDDLKKLLAEELPWKEVSITDVLKVETGKHIQPKDASRLGQVINPDFVKRVGDEKQWHDDFEALGEFFKETRFQAKDGTFQSPRDLLVAGDDTTGKEEALRAAFAPDTHVLDDAYDADGLEFFRACRGEMRAPAETLAEWGRDAVGEEKRQAFLRYLLQGDLANQVRQHLRQSFRDTWLKDAECVDQLEDLDHGDRLILHGTLGHGQPEAPRPSDLAGPLTQLPGTPVDSASALQSIFDWWIRDRDRQVVKYEQRTYPDGGSLFDRIRHDFGGSAEERLAWFTLLLRGSLETVGRATHEQHRDFLRLIAERGWLRLLLDSDMRADSQIEPIQRYLDRQSQEIKHYHSIKQYLPITLIARWLDDYVAAFRFVNQMQGPMSMDMILCPRTNQQLSGVSDAPPLAPVVGIGGYFILRELVRKKVVTNSEVHHLCYVPSKRVRNLVWEIGGPDDLRDDSRQHMEQSRTIHAFLRQYLGRDRAIFMGDFDLPLECLALDQRLREAVLKMPVPTPAAYSDEEE